MDDLDRLLADTMRDAAECAPSDDDLLDTVHRRSDRLRRQRIGTALSAVAAVLAVAIPTVVTLVARTPATVPPPAATAIAPPPSSPAATGSPAVRATGSPSRTATRTTSSAGAVRLVDGYTPPAFPYTLPAADGLKAPVASMAGGNLIALFAATEQRHHADVTVTVSTSKPAFTGTTVPVRGHQGILRTVDVQPAKQLTLYWPEAPARWISLATDDTYTRQQVVALADALRPASIAVLPPFRLDLSPAGFTTDTISESTMSFRASASAPDADRIEVVLRKRRQLGPADVTVGAYQGVLAHDAGGVTLDVDVTDWNATLEVTAGNGLGLSDTDLVRFAAAVHILNRSNPV